MTGNKAKSRGGMIPEGYSASRRIWVAPLGLMFLLLLTELGGEPLRLALRYDRAAIDAGQWYRLLSGSFVHLGWYHWFLNQLGLIVLVLLCGEALPLAVWLRRLVILCLGMSLGLYVAEPRLQDYVGMSGVIHGLFVLGLLPQVLKKDLIGIGCLVFLVGKLLYELFAGAPVSDEQAIGGHVVTASHFYGALSAFVYALIFRSYRGHEGVKRQ